MNKIHAFRLKPGDDLKRQLQAYVTSNNIKAGWMVCCVGSLTTYSIRFANETIGKKAEGFFEILSLNGTLSINGCHLHIAISDNKGQTLGGHLLEGNIIYTTAEIIIEESSDLIFTRTSDGTTRWAELEINNID